MISLMNIKDSEGAKTVPCGTPESAVEGLLSPLITTV